MQAGVQRTGPGAVAVPSAVRHRGMPATALPAAEDVNGADAFDAIVQAANPAHPDHAAWKERYGGSMRSSRKSADGHQSSAALQSVEGSVRRQRSKTIQKAAPANSPSPRLRPSLDSAGLRGRQRIQANEETASGNVDGDKDLTDTQHKGKGVASADEQRYKRKKRKDKGKGKAGPPPVPPPRTTSHAAFQDSPLISGEGGVFSADPLQYDSSALSMARRPSTSAPTSPNTARPSQFQHPAAHSPSGSSMNEYATLAPQRTLGDAHRFNDVSVRQRGKSFDVSRADISNGYNPRGGTLPYRLSSKAGDLAHNDAQANNAKGLPGRRSIDFRLPNLPVDPPPTTKKGFESLFASLRNAASKNSTLRSDKQQEEAGRSPLPPPILRFPPGRPSMTDSRRDPPPPPPPRSPLRAQAASSLDNVREESRDESRDESAVLRDTAIHDGHEAKEELLMSGIRQEAGLGATSVEEIAPVTVDEGTSSIFASDPLPGRIAHSRSVSTSMRSDEADDFFDARSAAGEEATHSRSVSNGTADRDGDVHAKQYGRVTNGGSSGIIDDNKMLAKRSLVDESVSAKSFPRGNTVSDLSTMSSRSYGGSSTHTRPAATSSEQDDAERTPRFPFSSSTSSAATGFGLPLRSETPNGQASPPPSASSHFQTPQTGTPGRHNLVQQRSYSRLGIFSRLKRDRTPSQPHLRASESSGTALSNESLAAHSQQFMTASTSNTSHWADQSTSASSITGLGIENALTRNSAGQAAAFESPSRTSHDGGSGWRSRLPSFSAGRALKSPPSAWHGVRSDIIPPVPRMPSNASMHDPSTANTLHASTSRSTSDIMGSNASAVGDLAPPATDSTTIHKTLSPALLTDERHEADEVGSFIGSEDAEEARENASKRGTWESFKSYELAPSKSAVEETNTVKALADLSIAPDELPSQEGVSFAKRDQALMTLAARRASRSSPGSKLSSTPAPLNIRPEESSEAEEIPERRRPSFTLRRSKSPMPFPTTQSSEAPGQATSNGQTKRTRNLSLGSTLLPGGVTSPKSRSSFAADRDRSPVINQIWADLPPSPSPRSSAVRKFFSTGKASGLRAGTRGKGLSNAMLYTPPIGQPDSPNEHVIVGQFDDSSYDRSTPAASDLQKSGSKEGTEMDRSTNGNGLVPSSVDGNATCESAGSMKSLDDQHTVHDVRSGGSIGSSAVVHRANSFLQDNSVGSIGTATEGSISSLATTDAPPSSLHSISTRSISASVAPSARYNGGRAPTPTTSIGGGSASSHTAHSNGTDRDAFDRMLRARAKDDAARLREIAQRGGLAPWPSQPPTRTPPAPPSVDP